MATALEVWAEAGRLLEHLPGLHDQKSHGRRFNIAGNAASGVKKALKAGEPGGARRRMSTIDVSTPHRAELAKMSVVDLRGQARSRELKPGKANKARLVDMIAEHELHGPGSVGKAVKDADHLSATTGRPPKRPSLNPSELTGRETDWWKLLGEDTGMEAVPVRDLEFGGGYLLKSGKAYRIDGITFIVEDDTGFEASRVVEEFRDVHRQLPPEADEYQQGYAWLAGRNPADAYWEQEYNIPGFRSAATAGDGAVRMWGRRGAALGPDSHMDSLMHEFGHNVSSAVKDRDLHDRSPAWFRASRADSGIRRPTDLKLTDSRLSYRLLNIRFDDEPAKGWPWGVSNYGKSSPAEDYAESMAFYLAGRLGTGQFRPGEPRKPVYFRDLFPERAKVFDQVFPEIARRQKAAISGR